MTAQAKSPPAFDAQTIQTAHMAVLKKYFSPAIYVPILKEVNARLKYPLYTLGPTSVPTEAQQADKPAPGPIFPQRLTPTVVKPGGAV